MILTMFYCYKSFFNLFFGLIDLLTCDKGSTIHKSLVCDGQWHCLDGRDEEDCGKSVRD